MNTTDGHTAACSAARGCVCEECSAHGPVTRLLMGIDHQVVFRMDANGVVTASAWTMWSETPRRVPIRLQAAQGGALKPKDRGRRRAGMLREIGGLLAAWGVTVVAHDKPGPAVTVPIDEIVHEVDERRHAGVAAEAELRDVAKARDFPYETVRRNYWDRKRDPTPLRPRYPLMEGPRGPDLAARIALLQADHRGTYEAATQRMAADLDWTTDQLHRQLFGCWRWDAALTHTWTQARGDWARIDDDALTTVACPVGPSTAEVLDRLRIFNHPEGRWTAPLRVAVEDGELVCEPVGVLVSLSSTASGAGPESLFGMILSERIRQIAGEQNLSIAQASAILADDMGWSSRQLCDRLVSAAPRP